MNSIPVYSFYLIACIPVGIGFALQFLSKRINWWEWAAGSSVGFILAGTFHFVAIKGMTRDSETWSGYVVRATHYPWWKERYTVVVTHSSGTGKNRRTWTTTETRYRDHPEHWDCGTSLGSSIDIDRASFEAFHRLFGNLDAVRGSRGGMCAGDPNDYVTSDRRGDPSKIVPVTERHSWENRVKAAPSLFSYAKLSDEVRKSLPDWPSNPNPFESNRVMGDAKVDRLEWDRMNARLGNTKLVNVIIVGFGKRPEEAAHQLEAKWIGGKKNDLVLCFGSDGGSTTWAYVFGWTERNLVKQQLATILLDGPVTTGTIPAIEREIVKDYHIKDWSKFDYIAVEPPLWSLFVLIVSMVLVQGGWYWWASNNQFDDEGEDGPMYRSSYYPGKGYRRRW